MDRGYVQAHSCPQNSGKRGLIESNNGNQTKYEPWGSRGGAVDGQ